MRTYGQFCAVARALDLVGDRWTLLIVRELLLQGPCRFTDLKNGLPGIATNLLSERLKELEAAGLITREAVAPPVATNVFKLTDTGRGLEPVVQALGLWGVQHTVEKRPDDYFRGQWLTYPVAWFLEDAEPSAADFTLQIVADDEPVFLTVAKGHIHTQRGVAADANLTLRGEPDKILGLLAGFIDVKAAKSLGVEIVGDVRRLKRIAAKTDHPMMRALQLN